RPLISSTAWTKPSSSRSPSARTASASIARTRRASSNALVLLDFCAARAAFIIGREYSPVTSTVSLASVLVLLASAVVAVALCRRLRLPPIVGYLATGLALGPHALGIAANPEETRHLAEFGIVFLMFSIGLEFSLAKLSTMRRVVFGLGGVQVLATLAIAIAITLAQAVVALVLLVLVGPRLMRAWLGLAARLRSNELFVLNVVLIILLLAYLTGLAGLSLVLGAFLAGMLISETEYRFQVEEDIKPYRDALLGLFFISVGMLLDPGAVIAHGGLVVMLFLALVGGKLALVAALSKVFSTP